jgi:hypothetical protein
LWTRGRPRGAHGPLRHLLLRAPTHIGHLGVPGHADLRLCHIRKGGGPALAAKEPAAAARLIRALGAGATPDFRRCGAQPRRGTCLLTALILADRLRSDGGLSFAASALLCCSKAHREAADERNHDRQALARHRFPPTQNGLVGAGVPQSTWADSGAIARIAQLLACIAVENPVALGAWRPPGLLADPPALAVQASSARSTFASCRSVGSTPSVNQP